MIFRIWDKTEKKWVNSNDGFFLTDTGHIVQVVKSGLFGLNNKIVLRDDCIYHASTTLTDVNGLGIFNGDILKLANVDNNFIGIVIFIQSKGAYVLLDMNEEEVFVMNEDTIKGLEVVGDVLSTPELLSGTKEEIKAKVEGILNGK